jgi:preprotein translocase subunit SecA
VRENLGQQIKVEDIERLERQDLLWKLTEAVEERFRPEMRRMERSILLQIVDMGWKDHLLAMDHLRSSIGLVGYAQVDPKVEYKREGMKIFDQMWESVGERVTDLIFRMEQLDEGFVGSTWVETSATHAQAASASDMARQQQDAIDASKGDVVVQTIRNRGQRVGRNDPCPCGSGKKYKNCCMRKMGVA